MAQARALEHDVFRRGPFLECHRCGQFWFSKRVDIPEGLGNFPGHQIYGKPEINRPWIVPAVGKKIRWGRQVLHQSHQAKLLRGALYCTKCGAWYSKGHIFRKVSTECIPNPPVNIHSRPVDLVRASSGQDLGRGP